jgi:putative intracellular protease/amidase
LALPAAAQTSQGKRVHVLMPWERQLQNEHDDKVQVLLIPCHIAAYVSDPLYAASATVGDGVQMQIVPGRHEKVARKLIQRVGGAAAAGQFDEHGRLQRYTSW